MSLNTVSLLGRLTADPELRHTDSGAAVCTFTLAVTRDYSGGEGKEKQTDFFNVVTWRKTAELVYRYFRKGSPACIAGRLQQRRWQDKDGQNRSVVEVIAESVYFTGSRENSSSPAQSPAPAPAPAASDGANGYYGEYTQEGDDWPF